MSGPDVTIPERLFSFREYQIHWYRWTAQVIKDEVHSASKMVESGQFDAIRLMAKLDEIVAEHWQEQEDRMVIAASLPSEFLRSKKDALLEDGGRGFRYLDRVVWNGLNGVIGAFGLGKRVRLDRNIPPYHTWVLEDEVQADSVGPPIPRMAFEYE
jgi:hypothetical protein